LLLNHVHVCTGLLVISCTIASHRAP
jgi:hypothetical protein